MSQSAQSYSCIRRAPSTEVGLDEAVRRLRDLAPRLVSELELELKELQEQLETLRVAICSEEERE